MAFPNVEGEIIAQGYNCHVRVGTTATDAEVIALVASFQANEDFQVQEAVCLGNLGPVSLDPQGYTCTVNMNGFLPFKRTLSGEIQYADGGKIALMDIIPSRAKIMEAASFKHKIVYLDFYNNKADVILCAFYGVIITNNGVDAEGNSYVRNNVQARALDWDKA